jgi:hypothetical protein
MMHRIPRRVNVGRGYYVEVLIVSPTVLKEELEEDEHTSDGAWFNELGPRANGKTRAGKIMISSRLNSVQRWSTYWHEMIHVMNDIACWESSQVAA